MLFHYMFSSSAFYVSELLEFNNSLFKIHSQVRVGYYSFLLKMSLYQLWITVVLDIQYRPQSLKLSAI